MTRSGHALPNPVRPIQASPLNSKCHKFVLRSANRRRKICLLKSNFFVSFKSNDLGVSFTMNKVTNNTFVEFSKQNMRLLKPSVFVLVVILLGLQLPEYSLQYIQSGTKRTPQWFSLFGQGASVWLQIVLLTELILICLSYFKKSDGD